MKENKILLVTENWVFTPHFPQMFFYQATQVSILTNTDQKIWRRRERIMSSKRGRHLKPSNCFGSGFGLISIALKVEQSMGVQAR